MPRTRAPAADRRIAIIDAAAEILLERGLAAATTRDVTARLGVGAGLLNHYFTWSDLRARALAKRLERDLAEVLPEASDIEPGRAMQRFVDAAFTADADPIWRLWIEAIDLAASDHRIATVIRDATRELHDRIERLIARGAEAGAWQCPDPSAATVRILAAHDGLVGFVITQALPLDRSAARRHLHAVVAQECAGYGPPSPRSRQSKTSRL